MENLLVGVADDTQDFGGLMDNFVDSVGIAAKNILPRVETILGGIGSLVEGLAPVVAQAVPQLVTTILPSMASAAASLLQALRAVWSSWHRHCCSRRSAVYRRSL